MLYLRDINLPKADKYGTSQVMAFLQQLLTYQGFYDSKLEFVGEIGLHGMTLCVSEQGPSPGPTFAHMGKHSVALASAQVVTN